MLPSILSTGTNQEHILMLTEGSLSIQLYEEMVTHTYQGTGPSTRNCPKILSKINS